MASAVFNAFEIARPALFLGLYGVLIGLGVQAAVARYARFPRSIGIVMGIGLSVVMVAMVYSHRLLGNVLLPIVPFAILASISILLQAKRSTSVLNPNGNRPPRRFLTHFHNPIASTDFIAAVAAVLVLAPVLKYGLAPWTSGTNDFPNYAASAEIWVDSASAFAERHPDAFGGLQLLRASFEKPMVTALISLTSTLSGVPPYQLLTPTLLVVLFVLISALLVLARALFTLGHVTSTVAVLIPTFSVVPISRVYDAQLGQVTFVALAACLLAILAMTAFRRTHKGQLALVSTGAIAGAAALGSNFTLALGSAIILGALLIWILAKRPTHLSERVILSAKSALATAALSVPMVTWYQVSMTHQTSGGPGFNVPLASPLAAIGQQVALFEAGAPSQVLLFWVIVLATAAALLWSRSSDLCNKQADFFLLAATLVNASIIGFKLGWNNYAVHKWFAVAIALGMPLLLCYAVSSLRGRARIASVGVMILLAASSVTIGLRRGFAIPHVIGHDLINLQNNALLATTDFLNIRLGEPHQNSFAALAVPSRTVTVIEKTYAPASPPNAGPFLVRKDQVSALDLPDLLELNQTYALTSTVLALDGPKLEFNSNNPASRRFLFGSWHPPETWGTWSSGTHNYVVFDLPPELQARDFSITVTGYAFAKVTTPQDIEVVVNDISLLVQPYPNQGSNSFTVSVPRQLTESSKGRVTVNFKSKQPLSPSAFGSADKRLLAFGLVSLEVGSSGLSSDIAR